MAAKTQPTKDEWKQIEEAATSLYSRVRLEVDGYDIMLELGRITKTRLAICVWVDGAFKGEWCKPGHEVARRFYRVSTRHLFSRKEISQAEKDFGKRIAKKTGYYATYEAVSAHWPSFSRLKSHLIKNNDSIIWLTDSAKEARAA